MTGVRRRVLGALAVTAALTTAVTVGVRPTSAAWVSTARLGQSVGVASSTCTTPGVYRTTASSRFLAGSVAGVPLTGASALAPVTADNPASVASFSSGATPRGGDGASRAVTNSSVAAAVQSAGGVTGLTAPAGSQTQYAAATSTGTSVAGAGSVTNGGAVDTAGIAGGTRPAVGLVDVSAALGAIPGGTAAAGQLSGIGLAVGNAASTATLNECARRWGASLSSALGRSTTVSGLSLSTRSAALTSLVGAIAAQRSPSSLVPTAFSGISGTDATSTAAGGVLATAKTGLTSALTTALGTLSPLAVVGVPTGSVSITSNLAGVGGAATGTTTGGASLVSLDGGTGTITADLSKLVDPTAPAPNTTVLTAGRASSIATAAGTAAGTLVSNVGDAWDAAAAGTTISVDVTVSATLLGSPLATVHQQMSGTLADFLDSGHVWPTPDLTLVGLGTGPLLAALNLQTTLFAPVRATVTNVVSTPLGTAIGAAEGTLSTALTTARSALPSQLATLPTLLSITLNEQPDVAPYPAPAAGTGGGHVVTALRMRAIVAGADALDLAIASSSVGPDTTVNQ